LVLVQLSGPATGTSCNQLRLPGNADALNQAAIDAAQINGIGLGAGGVAIIPGSVATEVCAGVRSDSVDGAFFVTSMVVASTGVTIDVYTALIANFVANAKANLLTPAYQTAELLDASFAPIAAGISTRDGSAEVLAPEPTENPTGSPTFVRPATTTSAEPARA